MTIDPELAKKALDDEHAIRSLPSPSSPEGRAAWADFASGRMSAREAMDRLTNKK
mgnify:CR=1 FL=1